MYITAPMWSRFVTTQLADLNVNAILGQDIIQTRTPPSAPNVSNLGLRILAEEVFGRHAELLVLCY